MGGGCIKMNPNPKLKAQKMIKKVDEKYKRWIRQQKCVGCNRFVENYITAAHMRILGNGGTALKPPDWDLWPLCTLPETDCHGAEHRGAVTFFKQGTKPKTKEYVQKLCDEHIERYIKEVI